MESILTVRLDSSVKERGSAVMRSLGTSPSEAVRDLFDFAMKNEALPFMSDSSSSEQDIAKKVSAFDRCHTKKPLNMTDRELRMARLKERHGLDD